MLAPASDVWTHIINFDQVNRSRILTGKLHVDSGRCPACFRNMGEARPTYWRIAKNDAYRGAARPEGTSAKSCKPWLRANHPSPCATISPSLTFHLPGPRAFQPLRSVPENLTEGTEEDFAFSCQPAEVTQFSHDNSSASVPREELALFPSGGHLQKLTPTCLHLQALLGFQALPFLIPHFTMRCKTSARIVPDVAAPFWERRKEYQQY